MTKKLSILQKDIVERLNDGWYLKKDIYSFLWTLIDERTGTALRIGKRTAESLIMTRHIEVVANRATHFSHCEIYTLRKERRNGNQGS